MRMRAPPLLLALEAENSDQLQLIKLRTEVQMV